MKKKINKVLAVGCLVLGTFFSLYVGGWLMLIKPIHLLITSYNSKTLELNVLIFNILKVAFSTTFAGLVWCVGYVGFNHFIGTEDPDWAQIERERGRKEEEIDS